MRIGEFQSLATVRLYLDVFNGEHEMIPGTDVHIPYTELEKQVDVLPEDKTTPIAIYRRLDPMSISGSKTLSRLGYTNITKLRVGTTAWRKRGYSLQPSLSTLIPNHIYPLQTPLGYSCMFFRYSL